MEDKYEFTDETLEHEGKTLHRIRALRDFGSVKAGDLGGWVACGPIGSRNDYTTFFRDSKLGVRVVCGCFSGSLDEFEKAVNKTHPYDQHGMEYRALIALARIRFAYVFDEIT